MKKILFFFSLLVCIGCYSQTGPISSRPAAVALSNTDLFLISQGATSRKLTYLLFLQELYSDLDSVSFDMIGLNPVDTIYPGIGKLFFDTDDSTLYICVDDVSWTEVGSGSGTIDGSGTATQIAYFGTSTNIGSISTTSYTGSTIKITTASSDTGLYISNSSTGSGLLMANTSTGYGTRIINSGTGQGLRIMNQSTGTGAYLINSSAVGAAGSAARIFTTGLGDALVVQDDAGAEFTIDSAGSVYLNKFDTDVADTVALIMYKLTGLVDTATFYHGSAAWDWKLISFRKFHRKNVKLKSLPLPYPDLGTAEAHGQERREMNAKFQSYQVETELERINRYHKRLLDKTDCLIGVVVILFLLFIYQQVQIIRLKKKVS